MEPRVLFICKQRQHYNGASYGQLASGLRTSVRMVIEMLSRQGIIAKMVDVVDNNCIDREVTAFKPSHVIIEALWVVPEKFAVLRRLHPRVKWFIRLHSEVPFLAAEGTALGWISGYLEQGVSVAANSTRAQRDLTDAFAAPILFLPNHYSMAAPDLPSPAKDGHLHIACFGAIRPLKNQLIQALAALQFARRVGKTLTFHINGGRIEGRGETVLKNLRALFATPSVVAEGHNLREWGWLEHADFKEVCAQMDLGLQVSFSETYNIVAADMVDSGVAVIVSPEVRWAHRFFWADPTELDDIVRALHRVYRVRALRPAALLRRCLRQHNDLARNAWTDFVEKGMVDNQSCLTYS